MTVTVTTNSKPIGFSKSDVIDLIQNACTNVGYNAAPLTGLVIGIVDWSTNGGGLQTGGTGYSNIPVDGRGGYLQPRLEGRSESNWYYDVPSTGGTGTGCSFDININGTAIGEIIVNRPGVGYAVGDTVTIDGTIFDKDDGDITVEVLVATEPVTGNIYEIAWDAATNTWSGSDRNGTITYTGGNTGTLNIAIQVGDIIKIDQGGPTDLDYLIIGYPTPSSVYKVGHYESYEVGNAIGGNTTVDNNRIIWQPMHGQGGTYRLYKANDPRGTSYNNWTITVTELGTSFQTLASFGGTSTFFDKQTPQGASSPYGVLRRIIDGTKKYGKIYTTFQISADSTVVSRLAFQQTNEYMPSGMQWYTDGVPTNADGGINHGTDPTRFHRVYEAYGCGRRDIDIAQNPRTANHPNDDGAYNGYIVGAFDTSTKFADENAFNAFSLDLITYQSGIDPNCVVFSFKQPNLSSTQLTDNTFSTFILHHYNSTLWDYDHVMLVGLTQIISNPTGSSGGSIIFRSRLGGNTSDQSHTDNPCQRSAEIPFLIQDGDLTNGGNDSEGYVETRYATPISAPGRSSTNFRTNVRLFTQITGDTVLNPSLTGSQRYDGIRPSSLDFNAVVKGIPINATLAPVPYYLPDDFALISFKIETPDANIQQGDTITVSASEVYTVITGSYNQTSYTSGVLFCARTT
jgi:hypothetical protein